CAAVLLVAATGGFGNRDDFSGGIAASATTPSVGSTITGAVQSGLLPQIFLQIADNGEESQRVAATLRRGLGMFDAVQFLARQPESTKPGDFQITIERGAEDGQVHL